MRGALLNSPAAALEVDKRALAMLECILPSQEPRQSSPCCNPLTDARAAMDLSYGTCGHNVKAADMRLSKFPGLQQMETRPAAHTITQC